jgi:DNA-binding transcriptional MerR regulator
MGIAVTPMDFTPTKLYYKIGEVCRIVGVEAHVLRYWETEFPALAPQKSRGGQRIYRPKDIELLLEIRRLLYEEGFTIAGARKHLGRKGRAGALVAREGAGAQRETADGGRRQVGAPLREVRKELENILTLLDRE